MLRLVSLTLLLLAVVSSQLRAGIIVTIQDATIAAGGSGFVDVLVSSSLPMNLQTASYDFRISLVGNPARISTLQFANPQDLTEIGLANYVFAGVDPEFTPIRLTNSQFVADTWAQNLAGVNLTATTRLLARLDLESVLGPGGTPALANGEQFRISLVDSGGDTLFLDNNGGVLDIDPISFTNSGLITVQDITAVPEPSSLSLFAIAAIATGWRMRRKPNQGANLSTTIG